jgi:D-arginine dehydrogenase
VVGETVIRLQRGGEPVSEPGSGPAADADIAIVGAGIIGCLTARTVAARSEGASVVVLDQDAIGNGASRRSAGLHFPRGASDRVREMSAYSQDYYRALLNDDPSLPIYPAPMSVVAAEANSAIVSGQYLERAALVREGQPADFVCVPEGTAVWSGQGCNYAEVGLLAQAIARGLRQRVTFREAVHVTAVEPGPSGITLRLGAGESVVAGAVVIAPGPWLAAPAWRAYVTPLGARVKKIVALHIERRPGPGDRVIVFEDEDAFLLPLPGRGHWLFSYTCQDWDVDPNAIGGLSDSDIREGLRILRHWSPALADAVAGGRVFCDAYSASREPLIEALGGDRRLVFAGAANGSGYRLAPAIAAAAADLLCASSGQGRH